MTAATLFSGIGAPEVAMPHWRWLWHAEIEKFPSAVMSIRHSQSVNLGDVTADDFVERALAIGRPDVLVFGSPCQSYSVAGKRLVVCLVGHHARKERRDREAADRFHRIMQASTPRAPGFKSRRIS